MPSSLRLVNIPDFATALQLCGRFLQALPDLRELGIADREKLLVNRVEITMTVLAVFLKDDHLQDRLSLPSHHFCALRECFAGVDLHWEEVAMFVSVLLTFDARSPCADHLYSRLCYGLIIKLSARMAEDENVGPGELDTKSVDLYTKLINMITQLFR